MNYILSYLRPYKLHVFIAYTLTITELIIELLLPLFLGKMINNGVVHNDLNNVVMWGSIMIGLALFAFITGILNSYYASHTSNLVAYDLRRKLFEKVQSFSFEILNKFSNASLITRFTNDVRQVQNTIYMGLRIMAKAPLLVIGSVIMSLIINFKLAAIFLIIVPIVIFFTIWIFKKAAIMFNNVQSKTDNVNFVMQENLSNMRLIKAFVRKNFEKVRFKTANDELSTTMRRAFRFVDASMPALLFIMNVTIIYIIWFGSVQTIADTSNIGDVVALINYALRIAMSISMFTFIILAFSRMKASSERLSDVLLIDSEFQDEKQTNSNNIINGSVQFKNVSFSYPETNRTVLKDVSFSVKRNTQLAIMGATGAGKTTLFQLIPRLYEPSCGLIEIDNIPITNFSLDTLRNSIGYVPQNPLLFSGSIKDNLIWGKEDASDLDIIEACKSAQIHDLIMTLPQQYDTEVSQQGVNLSGGQKQRLSIARALIRKPNILMLDDCTSALDLTTETNLLNAIEKDGCTTLIITQKISTAKHADAILLLDYGEMLDYGKHEDLISRSSIYKQIVASQSEGRIDDDK